MNALNKFIKFMYKVVHHAFGGLILLDVYCLIMNNHVRTWRMLIADIVLFIIIFLVRIFRGDFDSLAIPKD